MVRRLGDDLTPAITLGGTDDLFEAARLTIPELLEPQSRFVLYGNHGFSGCSSSSISGPA